MGWGVGRMYSVAEMRRQECTRGEDEMGHCAKAGEEEEVELSTLEPRVCGEV